MGRMAALILLVLCLAAPCLAEPATPYAADTMLYYPMLTAPQQQLFDLIYHVVLRGMERIELPEGTSYDDARTAMEAVRLDCPELSQQMRQLCDFSFTSTEDLEKFLFD